MLPVSWDTQARPPARAATGGIRRGKGYQEAARPHDGRPGTLGELIHEAVRRAIELAVEEELMAGWALTATRGMRPVVAIATATTRAR